MEPTNATDLRLTELEIKASYTEDLLDQLNQIIVQQQEDIRLLARELALLKHQPQGGEFARNPQDELPPHY